MKIVLFVTILLVQAMSLVQGQDCSVCGVGVDSTTPDALVEIPDFSDLEDLKDIANAIYNDVPDDVRQFLNQAGSAIEASLVSAFNLLTSKPITCQDVEDKIADPTEDTLQNLFLVFPGACNLVLAIVDPQCCPEEPSAAPSASPSASPTAAPVTSAPTPTGATPAPTLAPVTSAPVTLAPTSAPTTAGPGGIIGFILALITGVSGAILALLALIFPFFFLFGSSSDDGKSSKSKSADGAAAADTDEGLTRWLLF